MLAALTNTLSLIYTHLYFPTYSNGRKEVGRCIGASWTDSSASGLQSIVWRARWAAGEDDECKERLLVYNLEDCAALRRVTELARSIVMMARSEAAAPGDGSRPQVSLVADVEQLSDFRTWRRLDFENKDFNFINSRAYFDYQQERVYVRTQPGPRRVRPGKGASPNRGLRPNRHFVIAATCCPACESERLTAGVEPQGGVPKPRLKRAFDLLITASGVRRRVIHCRSSVYRCEACGHEFVPATYDRLDKHFHGLKSWAMFHHVDYLLSMAKIGRLIEEQFGLRINAAEIQMWKSLMARAYAGTVQQLFERLLRGPLLHIDETEVKLQQKKGYVWVFAGLSTVVYLYRPNREGDFLRELLQGFRGVLISDFYATYDGLDCPQQKCLIHLMRDINQELLRNPFDPELKAITKDFGVLLRQIVSTIDEHGLRGRELRRYQKDVAQFFDGLAARTVLSEAGATLQERLLRYRNKLFTFIDHDGVPWNNNNAEHAIKQFAYYRERVESRMQEGGLGEYLTLLSVSQTCAYRGVSFLQFLLSKERDLDAYDRRPRHPPLFELELYPEGYVPPQLVHRHRLRLQQLAEHELGSPGEDPEGDHPIDP